MPKTVWINGEEFEVSENDSPSIPYRLYQKDRKKKFYAHDRIQKYAILDWSGKFFAEVEKELLAMDKKQEKTSVINYSYGWGGLVPGPGNGGTPYQWVDVSQTDKPVGRDKDDVDDAVPDTDDDRPYSGFDFFNNSEEFKLVFDSRIKPTEKITVRINGVEIGENWTTEDINNAVFGIIVPKCTKSYKYCGKSNRDDGSYYGYHYYILPTPKAK